MKSFIKWLIGVMFLLFVLSSFIWLVDRGASEISQRGLKNILSQVWEGEEN